MSEEKKIYCGSGKQVKDYDIVNYTICLSDLPKEHIYEFNGKKYINITGAKKKNADQFGKTHSLSINTYKPEKKQETKQEETDDLPF